MYSKKIYIYQLTHCPMYCQPSECLKSSPWANSSGWWLRPLMIHLCTCLQNQGGLVSWQQLCVLWCELISRDLQELSQLREGTKIHLDSIWFYIKISKNIIKYHRILYHYISLFDFIWHCISFIFIHILKHSTTKGLKWSETHLLRGLPLPKFWKLLVTISDLCTEPFQTY